MLVQEYLDKHMLSWRIEDAVNATVRAKTPDPILFIITYHALFGAAALFGEEVVAVWWRKVRKMSREGLGGAADGGG
ncbi:hypothetical protein SLEP1_g39249 [Rubroshorea leprosula]|uniref:Uncharacterized protein n=1 Tax=Rubroshorea leprosula TaxID=152421 RepID=A0AAV5KZU9_9ROSI|nr:hypothetical protein SLEP1_g39249 [Rubroshorea leprosula]